MKPHRGAASLLLAAFVAGSGCTSLRELPRGEYAAVPQRDHVRVETNEGLVYEFDYVSVSGDTLTGFRQRDTDGPVEDFGSLQIPLDDVRTLAQRKLDWYRTGLVGGGALAAIVAAGVSAAQRKSDAGPNPGVDTGGKGGLP